MCVSCSNSPAIPRGPGSVLGGTSDGGPPNGPGSDVSQGTGPGNSLLNYYYSLKARICPKCATFWIVLAVIALGIYLYKRRG